MSHQHYLCNLFVSFRNIECSKILYPCDVSTRFVLAGLQDNGCGVAKRMRSKGLAGGAGLYCYTLCRPPLHRHAWHAHIAIAATAEPVSHPPPGTSTPTPTHHRAALCLPARRSQDGACAVAVWVLQELVLVANVGDAKVP